MAAPKIKIAISACLLGEKVRYDGGHIIDHYITGTLGQWFEWVSICPEVAIGLGTPRPPIRLTGPADQVRAVGIKAPSIDPSTALRKYANTMARSLVDVSGYIFKSRSPSCGVNRVKRYHKGQIRKDGRGVFAGRLMERLPLLPVEEESRLGDPQLRDNFIARVFIYHRWQQLCKQGLTRKRLVEFHARHKLIVMAHGFESYRKIDQLLTHSKSLSLSRLKQGYIETLMSALKKRTTPNRQSRVLMHLLGNLKHKITTEEKQELLAVIEAYRQGRLPLIIPITLLRHHFQCHPDPTVDQQLYLNPSTPELMLRYPV